MHNNDTTDDFISALKNDDMLKATLLYRQGHRFSLIRGYPLLSYLILHYPDKTLHFLHTPHKVDIRCAHMYTPLMLAVEKGQFDTVERLLHLGANADLENKDHYNSAFIAMQYHRNDILKLLLPHISHINQRNIENTSIFDVAERVGNAEGIDILNSRHIYK